MLTVTKVQVTKKSGEEEEWKKNGTRVEEESKNSGKRGRVKKEWKKSGTKTEEIKKTEFFFI